MVSDQQQNNLAPIHSDAQIAHQDNLRNYGYQAGSNLSSTSSNLIDKQLPLENSNKFLNDDKDSAKPSG